jgi:hypothetical protein
MHCATVAVLRSGVVEIASDTNEGRTLRRAISMCSTPNTNPFPSIAEFDGCYNIPEQYHPSVPVLRSTEQLPEFGFPELWEVYKAAVNWFATAVPPLPRPKEFDPLAQETFVPRDGTDDRTLSIDQVDYARLSVALLRRIQCEFLRQFPLWRVLLVGWDNPTGIVVYPTAIRFGDQPLEVDPEAALREIIARGLTLSEAWIRPQRAYFAQLRKHLPDAVRAIGKRPFHVFGVLDNYEGKRRWLAVWILVRGAEDRAIGVEDLFEAGEKVLYRGRAYGIDSDGAMICSGMIPESVPFCLTTWLPPADYRGALTIVVQASGDRHVFELNADDIIRTSPEQ